MGILAPTTGMRHSHRNLKFGYFSQHHVDQLNMNLNSVELLQQSYPGIKNFVVMNFTFLMSIIIQVRPWRNIEDNWEALASLEIQHCKRLVHYQEGKNREQLLQECVWEIQTFQYWMNLPITWILKQLKLLEKPSTNIM